MKEKKAKEVKKVGRPHPKTAVVEEAKSYERTYEGFWQWAHETGRDLPMFALRDYCALEKIRVESKSHLMSEVIGQAQQQFRSWVFDEIKEFLDETKYECTWDAVKKGYVVKRGFGRLAPHLQIGCE